MSTFADDLAKAKAERPWRPGLYSRVSLEDALTVHCPRCGAEPGKDCRQPKGALAGIPAHTVRYRAADKGTR